MLSQLSEQAPPEVGSYDLELDLTLPQLIYELLTPSAGLILKLCASV